MVLPVTPGRLRNRGDYKSANFRSGTGAIALKITLEALVLLGQRQLVVRLGKVVHANKYISGAGKFLDCHRQDFHFEPGVRQAGFLKNILRRFELRQMGVTENCETVWIVIQYLI